MLTAIFRVGLPALRGPDAHVMALHIGMENAIVGDSPLFEMRLNPIRMLFQKFAKLGRVVSPGQVSRANQPGDDRGQG